jgi:hypothetical protein
MFGKADGSSAINDKQQALDQLRLKYAGNHFRRFKLQTKKTIEECSVLLGEDGVFSDLRQKEAAIRQDEMDRSNDPVQQRRVSELNQEAFDRLWVIAESFRNQKTIMGAHAVLRMKAFKGFIHYAGIEAGRAPVSHGRWHASCFAIPLACVNSYFCFFDDMQCVEDGTETDPLFVQANQALKTMGFQAWTQPFRNDETDQNVVSVERFRKHVWWVGGNAMPYRPLLGSAIMMNSIPMMDVVADVAIGAVSHVSQTTYDDAFWIEGLTSDGAGWGHGMQCQIWQYPLHGITSALETLQALNGTPWSRRPARQNLDALIHFVRGSSWYYCNGFVPPCLDRFNMEFDGSRPKKIPSSGLAKAVLHQFRDVWTPEERNELQQFVDESDGLRIRMSGQPAGRYSGSRYFYNNDDLIVKSDDFYFFINMASVRCDGIESAAESAAKYNFYTCDGQTLFLRQGDEARQAMGGMNLTAFPGVTARQGEERLFPITNWKGFCSKYNFAAGATRGGKNACAGFIFEKMNASAKPGLIDTAGLNDPTTVIYGVRAYKSWFVFGDILLALGAGVSNLEPEQEGDIWTTIDQTLWKAPVASKDWKLAQDGRKHEEVLKPRNSASAGIPWVQQTGGFTYAVLPAQTPGEVSLTLERRTSKWDKLAEPNRRKTNKPEMIDMFELRINHGHDVQNHTYGYIVYAGQNDPATVFAKAPVTVLANTTNLQAAASLDGTVVEAVFYDPKAVLKSNGHIFSVSAPCVFMAEFEENGIVHLTCTDAEMNTSLNEIRVKLDAQEVVIQLPTESCRGKPATVDLRLTQP